MLGHFATPVGIKTARSERSHINVDSVWNSYKVATLAKARYLTVERNFLLASV